MVKLSTQIAGSSDVVVLLLMTLAVSLSDGDMAADASGSSNVFIDGIFCAITMSSSESDSSMSYDWSRRRSTDFVFRFFCLRSPAAFDGATAAAAAVDVVVSLMPCCLFASTVNGSSDLVGCVGSGGGGGGGIAGGGTGSGRFIAFNDSDPILNFGFCFASHFSRLANF